MTLVPNLLNNSFIPEGGDDEIPRGSSHGADYEVMKNGITKERVTSPVYSTYNFKQKKGKNKFNKAVSSNELQFT